MTGPTSGRRGGRGGPDAWWDRHLRRDHHRRPGPGLGVRHAAAEHRPGGDPGGWPVQPGQRPADPGRRLAHLPGRPYRRSRASPARRRPRAAGAAGRRAATWPGRPAAPGWWPTSIPRSATRAVPRSPATHRSTGWRCGRCAGPRWSARCPTRAPRTMRSFAGRTPVRTVDNAIDVSAFTPTRPDRVPPTVLFVGVVCRRKGTLRAGPGGPAAARARPDRLAAGRRRRPGPDPGAGVRRDRGGVRGRRPRRQPGRSGARPPGPRPAAGRRHLRAALVPRGPADRDHRGDGGRCSGRGHDGRGHSRPRSGTASRGGWWSPAMSTPWPTRWPS